jgi:hypothetical protein
MPPRRRSWRLICGARSSVAAFANVGDRLKIDQIHKCAADLG